jgi:hypothetical protein
MSSDLEFYLLSSSSFAIVDLRYANQGEVAAGESDPSDPSPSRFARAREGLTACQQTST